MRQLAATHLANAVAIAFATLFFLASSSGIYRPSALDGAPLKLGYLLACVVFAAVLLSILAWLQGPRDQRPWIAAPWICVVASGLGWEWLQPLGGMYIALGVLMAGVAVPVIAFRRARAVVGVRPAVTRGATS